ncbi:MAG: tetratricopeptide repeat protein [Acidobacteria bacterium]|nr:tetratricopeptide repeat protein [Acidobacteriota bacterium]
MLPARPAQVMMPRWSLVGLFALLTAMWSPADVRAAQAGAEPPTWVEVAPIVFEACTPCHRPGGPGPFSLTTYREVRQRARQVVQVTRSRFMPPWKVDPAIGHFADQRPLSAGELDRLEAWVTAGTPEGDPAAAPRPPTFADGWLLGTPDLIVTLPEAFVLNADPSDTFRIFALPVPIRERRYVRGIEFHPGNPRVVHHANIRVDRTPTSRRLDAADPLPGYDGLMPRTAEYPDGHFLGWTPGQVAPLVSPDLAWTLEPGSDLVVQLHMQPSGAIEDVRPAIGLYFSETPPTRTPTILRLGSQGIDMAPGDAVYTIRDTYTLPVDADILAIQPHAHYRATEIIGEATFPDGRTQRVMHITDWDFRWQHVYRLITPLSLPRGTRLSMAFTYNNSSGNPRNPDLTPTRVLWGQRSRDEMGDLWFQLLARSDTDRARLTSEITTKMVAEDIIGYETMLTVTPDDVELHDDVAVLYLDMGRPLDAVRHFRASVARRPAAAPAHYNLGTALTMAGQVDEGVRELERAVELDPQYGVAYGNLGSVLLQQGRIPQAIARLEKAVALSPGNVEALNSLSAAYAVAGDTPRALDAIDKALTLKPPAAMQRVLRQRRDLLTRQR